MPFRPNTWRNRGGREGRVGLCDATQPAVCTHRCLSSTVMGLHIPESWTLEEGAVSATLNNLWQQARLGLRFPSFFVLSHTIFSQIFLHPPAIGYYFVHETRGRYIRCTPAAACSWQDFWLWLLVCPVCALTEHHCMSESREEREERVNADR